MPDVSNCLYIGNEGTPIAVLSLTVKEDVPTAPQSWKQKLRSSLS